MANAGYKDPNNLKFENITILGLPFPPTSIKVFTFNGNRWLTNVTTYNEYYDPDKKVQKPFFFFCSRTDSKVK